MHDIDAERVDRLARALTETDDVVAEMDERAATAEFPTVGRAVGGWLRLLVRLVDAKRVFEFGSGFGYSAYWFASALPDDGDVVLTETDAERLDQARTYLERGGYADRARFEQGDALEIVDRYDGPFDIVLLDNEKERYPEAFAAVREKVAPGGVVVVDNAMTATPLDFDGILALVEGAEYDANEATRGVAELLTTLRGDPAFDTALLPLGDGVALAHKHG